MERFSARLEYEIGSFRLAVSHNAILGYAQGKSQLFYRVNEISYNTNIGYEAS